MTFADYQIEEHDDPRTWQPSSLIPDCEPRAEDCAGELVSLPNKAHSERTPDTDKFWDDFEHLLYACGQTAYYWHMVNNIKKAPPNRAKDIATKYQHSLNYYREQKRAWIFEARRALGLWQLAAHSLGIEFHFSDDESRNFLNSLLDSDRRDCARDTVRYAKPKGILLTPDEIESRYIARLNRRKNKRSKSSGKSSS